MARLTSSISDAYISEMNYPLSDEEFAAAVERCEAPDDGFHHRDHLRLAWIYLRRYGAAEAGRELPEPSGALRRIMGSPRATTRR
jgi:hypothetical protein